uniref:Uncharacterized protein n=1 Tax=Physcomitrium patens TaxID=3218 RepID=A0A2K1ITB3_PHYPA|nr:hypothetical protein PHYPA_024468 [Physcomitrium patens]PNR32552.1 hypothetical protein PHYPA_024494 [Physcomitrium patens]
MHRARKGPLGLSYPVPGGGGAKVRHSTVRTGTGISRGRVREGGKDPPFGT